MDQKHLEEIKAREQAATPGPWKHEYTTDGAYVHDGDAVICRCTQLGDEVDFIAHARTDIPELIAEVERLTVENTALQSAIDKLTDQNKRVIHRGFDQDQQIATLKKALELAEDMLTKMTPFKSKGGWHDRLMEQAQQTHETQGEAEK